MLGIIGIFTAIALLIFLAYKGWNIIVASLICSLIVVLTSYGDIFKAISTDYANGFKYFAGTYFVIFVLGALFGQVMGDSGSATAVSRKLLGVFGESRAILVTTLATAVLTYGGVSVFIVIFTVYPLALILFKSANLPKRLIAASVGIGAATFTMTALPGSPSIQNLIPAQVLGTTATAAPFIGILCSGILLFGGLWYLNGQAKKALANNEGFVPGPRDNMEKLSLSDSGSLPNWIVALLPLLVVIGLIIGLRGKLDALFTVVIALTVGIVLTYILNWKRITNPLKTMNDGCMNSVGALINTSAIVAFGFVVQGVPAFQSFIQFALGLSFDPLISTAIGVNIVAGITGSASGGLTIFMQTLGPALLEKGANPEVLHRVASIASGGLDSLPHSGAVITLLTFMGLSHKEAYKDLGVVTVIVPLIAVVVAVAIGIILF